MNPMKAIRAKCLECCCDSVSEVKECNITGCPLHPFRMGKNPFRKKVEMSDERKRALAENLEKYRAEKSSVE